MKVMKLLCALVLCFGMLCSSDTALAHHGGTHSHGGYGGHHHEDAARYYCGGHSAHCHYDGVCPYASSAENRSGCYRASTVKKVQRRLNKLGYSCGSVNGVCGAKTRKAIESFQSQEGLKVNGKINKALLKKLKIKK